MLLQGKNRTVEAPRSGVSIPSTGRVLLQAQARLRQSAQGYGFNTLYGSSVTASQRAFIKIPAGQGFNTLYGSSVTARARQSPLPLSHALVSIPSTGRVLLQVRYISVPYRRKSNVSIPSTGRVLLQVSFQLDKVAFDCVSIPSTGRVLLQGVSIIVSRSQWPVFQYPLRVECYCKLTIAGDDVPRVAFQYPLRVECYCKVYLMIAPLSQ